MKGVLPWLVRWARRAGTRGFCPALAVLQSAQYRIFFSLPHTISLNLSTSPTASWTGSRAASPVS
jgi:hypothetical protein